MLNAYAFEAVKYRRKLPSIRMQRIGTPRCFEFWIGRCGGQMPTTVSSTTRRRVPCIMMRTEWSGAAIQFAQLKAGCALVG